MRKRIISLGVMALLFAACSVNEMDIATPTAKDAEEFFATIEDASTRVFVDDDLMVLWHADDRVSIFNKYTYNQQYRFTGNTGANSGSFTKVPNDDFVTGNALNSVYAIYPYKESTEISNQGVLTIDLPATQSYAENSFGIGANTMVSCSEGNELLFKNLCGYIMLKLYGDDVTVKSISIKGNNDEPLAGKATINASVNSAPTLTFDASATKDITLSFDTPVTLGTTAETATTFWLVVPPTTFSKGFTLTMKDIKNGVFEKSTTKSFVISRNTLSRMSVLEVLPVAPIIPVASVALNKAEITLTVNKTEQLIATILPDDASDKSIIWTSENSDIATVDEKGLVTAVSPGNTTITAQAEEQTATCSVIVQKAQLPEGFAVQTTDVSTLTPLFATISGEYVVPNNIVGVSWGAVICLSSNPNPTKDDIVYKFGARSGSLQYTFSGLSPDTEYYYRAALYYDGDYFYADTRSFSTPHLQTTGVVDLGLSVNWSTCNLGATTTTDNGDYFAWGETETKPVSSFTQNNYAYYDAEGEMFINIGSDISASQYDAATVKLGEGWRMPTRSETAELRNGCTWYSATYNGKGGYLVVGKNGEFLFVVTVSCTWTNSSKLRQSQFWTSTLAGGNYEENDAAYYLNYSYFNTTNTFCAQEVMRWVGLPIRPVYGVLRVSNVSLDKNELDLSIGETSRLSANVIPEHANNKNIVWSSSNESVATVSSSGIVTASAAGSTIITVTTEDNGMTSRCFVNVKDPSYSVGIPEMVDLGLSVKWASFNLGASKPEEYGDYYAWGETEPYYSSQDPLTWKGGKEDGYNWASYKWCMGSNTTMTKYCTESDYGYNGFTDGKTVLDPEDDAAHVNLGGKWRMPTDAEWSELIENCTWTWTTQNGVNGYRVTGKKTGYTDKSIFLPAAGSRVYTRLDDVGSFGDYWSSSLYTDNPDIAWYVYFASSYVRRGGYGRYYGRSVRPVTE